MLNIRTRIAGPAGFAAVVIAIILAMYDVQSLTVPEPLATFLLVTLLLMLLTALGMIGLEVVNAVRQFFEHRATSASWVSSEAPGLLDYEADGERASKRFGKEMKQLSSDTQGLANTLAKHSARVRDLSKPGKKVKGTDKQKRANAAAKSIDRSAVYIEKRAKLFEALVKEIVRNYDGLITAVSLDTEEHKVAAPSLRDALQSNENATLGAITGLSGYRDSVRTVHQKNLSRTITIASKRLRDGLDSILKTLQQFQQGSRHMRANLDKKLR